MNLLIFVGFDNNLPSVGKLEPKMLKVEKSIMRNGKLVDSL